MPRPERRELKQAEVAASACGSLEDKGLSALGAVTGRSVEECLHAGHEEVVQGNKSCLNGRRKSTRALTRSRE
jgi:hypothetical protein